MNKEIKRICGKKLEEVTMVEYQNLKLSMLNQLGRIDGTYGTCEGVWCEDCCLNNGGSCITLEITHPQKAIELVQEWCRENILTVDWSTVPVDTPIWVWDDGWKGDKSKRHFAKYENGNIYAWCDGETSWTIKEDTHVSKWGNAELAEEK